MKKLALALAVASLGACNSPHLGSASEAGGIVSSYGWKPNKALDIASAHCAKFGKSARVSSQNDLQDNMTFDCV